MEDFNSFSKRNKNIKPDGELNGDLIGLITSLADKYSGASETEILTAIYKEAEKGRRNGTLTDRDLDNFANILAPLVDENKRAMLYKIVNQLKRK